MTQLLFASGVCVALILAVCLVGGLGYLLYSIQRSVRSLSVALSTHQSSDLPKLLEGHMKVAAKMAVEISALREAVQTFSRLITKPEDAITLHVPEEEEADKEFSIKQLLEERPEMSRNQAAQMIDSSLSSFEKMLATETK